MAVAVPTISKLLLKIGSLLVIGSTISGCTGLSKEGPTASDIEAHASAHLLPKTAAPIFNYALIPVDNAAMRQFAVMPTQSLFGTFGNSPGGSPQIRLGVGDVVQLTVFEAQPGGLFIPSEAGSRPGNYVTLPSQQIDGNGQLTIPYVKKKIRFAGRTIPEVQTEIVANLAASAIDPQVIISLGSQRSSQVSVVGEVRSPARIDINPRGDRVIDVIAKAGGPSRPGYETYVTLERNRRKSTVFFDDIMANSRENIFVHPDDTIYVYSQAKSFVAFGATNADAVGVPSKIDFGSTKLTLAEGLGRIGGLNDSRADGKKVFIYRVMHRKQLETAKLDLSKFSADQELIPVVFQFDFRDPSVYFAAQSFYLEDKDVVYVDNSGAYELNKLLTIISSVSSTARGVANSVTDARSANLAIRRWDQ